MILRTSSASPAKCTGAQASTARMAQICASFLTNGLLSKMNLHRIDLCSFDSFRSDLDSVSLVSI